MKKQYKMTCPIDPKVVGKLRDVIALIRKNPQKGFHSEELTARIVDLSSILMNYYFLESVIKLHTRPIFINMTKVGIHTGLAIVRKISQKLIGNLESNQLLEFVTHLESQIEGL